MRRRDQCRRRAAGRRVVGSRVRGRSGHQSDRGPAADPDLATQRARDLAAHHDLRDQGLSDPAHSVAVGGYADDPHTKGEAEDIGVNSLLRSSAAQISEAELARFGLYRPFDPTDNPGNTEVNHIQLILTGGPLTAAAATADFTPDPMCR